MYHTEISGPNYEFSFEMRASCLVFLLLLFVHMAYAASPDVNGLLVFHHPLLTTLSLSLSLSLKAIFVSRIGLVRTLCLVPSSSR